MLYFFSLRGTHLLSMPRSTKLGPPSTRPTTPRCWTRPYKSTSPLCGRPQARAGKLRGEVAVAAGERAAGAAAPTQRTARTEEEAIGRRREEHRKIFIILDGKPLELALDTKPTLLRPYVLVRRGKESRHFERDPIRYVAHLVLIALCSFCFFFAIANCTIDRESHVYGRNMCAFFW